MTSEAIPVWPKCWCPVAGPGHPWHPHWCPEPSVTPDTAEPISKPLTTLDAYQAIDEVVTQYQHQGVSAERAMSNIAAIIADYESGEDV